MKCLKILAKASDHKMNNETKPIDLVKKLHSLQIPCRQFCMPIWFPSLLASTTAISLEDVL